MKQAEGQPIAMLSGYRCLDISDEKGTLAGKLMGDMGADVIKIEKPGGDAARWRGPFYGNEPHPEKSLSWFAGNTSKRGITLNIESEEGRSIFRRLVATSDVVIESFPPGYLNELDLGYTALSQINRKIILTSITPFGQSGPYENFKTSDLVSMSMGGVTWLIGDPDRPPVTVGFPQAYYFAGSHAVIATLLALYHREATGEGQQVSISIQQSLVPITLNAIPHWTLNKSLVTRAGNRRAGLTSGAPQRQTWQCKDGYVTLTIYGGARGAEANRRLVEWMDEEGAATDYLKEKDWDSFDLAKIMSQDWETIEEPVSRFFLKHSKAELFREALRREIMLFPVYGFADLLSDNQLKARNFWVSPKYAAPGAIVSPGAFARCSETPIGIRRPAPAIGEHNPEIYRDELGIPEEQFFSLKKRGVI